MRIFWVVGEQSGDLQAASVAQAINAYDPAIKQWGWGGRHLEGAGVKLLANIANTQFMGFVEVLRKAGRIFKMLRAVKADIQAFQPDTIVLVDYPGFNMRIAKWAKSQGFRVVYFIPPKVWAWKSGRAKKIDAYCDEVLSILPFEQNWYHSRGLNLTYVGNPLREKYAFQNGFMPDSNRIALLPGSRGQEIERLLPIMLSVAKRMPNWEFRIIQTESTVYQVNTHQLPENVRVIKGDLGECLVGMQAALVCSGTATLEVALLGVPQIIMYMANPISLTIAKMFVKLPYFSLPNLILERKVLPELLQDEIRSHMIVRELDSLCANPMDQIAAYTEIKERLEMKQPAVNAAQIIIGNA
ncbi:MAG: hypothetical protein RL754_259 [Bacteroidota bacterium]|jgi:lipid-A-disaccharide synthase